MKFQKVGVSTIIIEIIGEIVLLKELVSQQGTENEGKSFISQKITERRVLEIIV